MEAEMDLHISKRERLSKKLEIYSKKLDDAINRNEVVIISNICAINRNEVVIISSMRAINRNEVVIISNIHAINRNSCY